MTSRSIGTGAAPDSTRNRIIDAALEIFAIRGFKGATTKDIAKRAKVNEVTLFRLFKSKKALFTAAVNERSPLAMIDKRVGFDKRRPVEECLFENIKTVLGVLRANKHLYMLMLGETWRQMKAKSSTLAPPLDKALDYVAEFLQVQMDAGRLRKSDARVSAMVLMGSVQFYFMSTYVMGNEIPGGTDEDRTIRGIVELFLNGMGAVKGGS